MKSAAARGGCCQTQIVGDDSIARPGVARASPRATTLPWAGVYGLLGVFIDSRRSMSLHRLAALAVLAATMSLAACSSTSGPELRASKPLIHVSSARTASDISGCLEHMLPSVQTTRANGSTELVVGPNAWLVTLTPSGYGSIVKVQKSDGEYSGLPEPELRFDIARCTT
jgi:hypothetical protein